MTALAHKHHGGPRSLGSIGIGTTPPDPEIVPQPDGNVPPLNPATKTETSVINCRSRHSDQIAAALDRAAEILKSERYPGLSALCEASGKSAKTIWNWRKGATSPGILDARAIDDRCAAKTRERPLAQFMAGNDGVFLRWGPDREMVAELLTKIEENDAEWVA